MNSKKVGIDCTGALRAILCTSAYPSGDKSRDDIYTFVGTHLISHTQLLDIHIPIRVVK